MKFRILNGEPLQFYNAQGALIGTIEIDTAGAMFIRANSGSGDITIGDPDTTGDVQIGTTAAPTTLTMMGGGTISSNGNALIIGNDSIGDRVSIRNASFTQSLAITGSLRVTGSAYADTFIGSGAGLTYVTASYVNTLNQTVIITGSLTVGVTSSGPSENTLTLGARDATSEGGQIGFNAPGGTYTSASFLDVYQNTFRILKGPNAGSTTQLAAVDLQTGNLTLNAGSIIMPTRPAFRVIGATTGAGADKATPTVLSGSLVTVDYNQGSNYNNTNGEFTCPSAGLYHVWYVGRTQNSSLAAVSILKNNTTVLAYWESNTNTGHFGSSAVVNLAANDIITAKVTAGTITFDTNDNWGVAYIG